LSKLSADQDLADALKIQAANDAQTAKELEAKLQGLSEEVKSIKHDNMELRRELEKERVEKGELVAAVEEMFSLQTTAPKATSSSRTVDNPAIASGMENLRGSISRASGLRAPNFSCSTSGANGESRIGRRGSGNTHGTRPGSGLGTRSGILSSIEKMGSFKGRSE